jgi:hypothetical protein
MQIDYYKGQITAVSFSMLINEKHIPFMLPCRWKAVYDALYKKKTNRYGEHAMQGRELHAKRVAWRQILKWIQAQLALVETNMVKVDEVFMPYMVIGQNGQTLYEKVVNDRYLLEGPKN